MCIAKWMHWGDMHFNTQTDSASNANCNNYQVIVTLGILFHSSVQVFFVSKHFELQSNSTSVEWKIIKLCMLHEFRQKSTNPPKKTKTKKTHHSYLLTKDHWMAAFHKQEKLERYIHISLPVCKTEEASGRTSLTAMHGVNI